MARLELALKQNISAARLDTIITDTDSTPTVALEQLVGMYLGLLRELQDGDGPLPCW